MAMATTVLVSVLSALLIHPSDGKLGMQRADQPLSARATGKEKRTAAVDSVGADNPFVVVFDAGSTGTRVHVYQFLRINENDFQLENEVYRKVKPGLSAYVHDPDQGAANIQPLIDIAVETVPATQRPSTPVVFKATAGLRLLDGAGADNLLNKVRESLAATDFLFDPEDVSIMSGDDEALFGWITINYLLDNRDGFTAATLDLGGGSLQVTYSDPPLQPSKRAEDLKDVNIFGNDYKLLTKSYLGQGLKAARLGILQDTPDSSIKQGACLPPLYQGTYHYAGRDYSIRGPPVAGIDQCWDEVKTFVSDSKLDSLRNIDSNPNNPHPDLFLFSYFFDVLTWAGLIEEDETGKILTAEEIGILANQTCTTRGEGEDFREPFLCQDLMYITAVLLKGLDVFPYKPLHVVSQITGIETSWALGAAVHSL